MFGSKSGMFSFRFLYEAKLLMVPLTHLKTTWSGLWFKILKQTWKWIHILRICDSASWISPDPGDNTSARATLKTYFWGSRMRQVYIGGQSEGFIAITDSDSKHAYVYLGSVPSKWRRASAGILAFTNGREAWKICVKITKICGGDSVFNQNSLSMTVRSFNNRSFLYVSRILNCFQCFRIRLRHNRNIWNDWNNENKNSETKN